MRRADRLFRSVQLLRGRHPVTARTLARKLEVSERTIYRDMQELSLSGVLVLGEAGSGYGLLPGFDLPPLMFNEEELMALLLGVRMVQAWSDRALSEAAEQALKKIESVLPDRLRPELSRSELMAPGFSLSPQVGQRLALVRKAIRGKIKLCLSYSREDGMQSERIIRPLGMVYWGKVWTLVAWCELRDDFRHFRLDRMQELEFSTEVFADESGKTLQDFFMTLPAEDLA
jgi:predicted DNA-binding transcriptional regulator YafY